jgi:hypothetical protein
VRWHSDDFPGWVEVSILDAHGQDHRIIEKVPVITPLDITPESSFPIEFWIEAEARSVDSGATVMMLPHGMETTEGKRSLVVVPTEVDQARYRHHRDWLDQAVHELPAGVLWGVDGATPAQCAEMLDDLDDFARVCARLGLLAAGHQLAEVELDGERCAGAQFAAVDSGRCVGAGRTVEVVGANPNDAAL